MILETTVVVAAANPLQGLGQGLLDLIVGIGTWLWEIAATLAQDSVRSVGGAIGVYHFCSFIVSMFHRARGGLAETAHRHIFAWEIADHILGVFVLTLCLAPLGWIPGLALYMAWKHIYKGTVIGLNRQFRRELRVDALNTVRFWMAGILIYSAVNGSTMLDSVGKIVQGHLTGPASSGGVSFSNVVGAVVGSAGFWFGLIFTAPVAAFLFFVVLDEMKTKAQIAFRNGIQLGQPIPPGHRTSRTRMIVAIVDDVLSVALQLIAMAGGIAVGNLTKAAGGWLFGIAYIIWSGAYIGVRQPHFRSFWVWTEKVNDDTGKQASVSIASMLALGALTSFAIYTTALTMWGDLITGHVH